MEWFFLTLVIISALFFALTSFFDNYVTDTFFRGRRPEAQKIFSVFTYALTIIVLLIISPPTSVSLTALVLALGAGIVSSLSTIFYYRALAKEDTTSVAILTQLTPVFALISGIFILGEAITPLDFLAIGFLLFAASLIIFSRGTSRTRLHGQLRVTLLLLVFMLLYVGSDTLFILSGEQFDFPTGFFYFIVGKFITEFSLMLIMKSWRIRIKNVIKEFRGRVVGTAIVNEALDLSANLIWRIAILSAPIAIATAVENVAQLIATFIFGLVFTILWPRFGREKLTRRKVSSHLVALIFASVAILLIQFT